jgi:adenosine deaminase
MNTATLYEQMRRFPKVDLHRHLEGSIRPETLLRVAKKYGGLLPTYDLEALRHAVQVIHDPPGFRNLLGKFKVFRAFYTCREAIEEIAATAVREAAEENVKYLELRYSPTHFSSSGRFPEAAVAGWIQGAIDQASRACDIVVTPILTISRDYGVAIADSTVALAISLGPRYFCGLDIAGDEMSNSAEPFAHLFAAARQAGLGLTIHAGEACGAANVRAAIINLKADRIGHGVHAAEDAAVMKLLAERNVLLELCLSSNVYTGAVSAVRNHPIRQLMENGVPVSLNTDDPAMFGLTLTDDYVLAVTELGFNTDELKRINQTALDHAFHPDKQMLKKNLSHCWD